MKDRSVSKIKFKLKRKKRKQDMTELQELPEGQKSEFDQLLAESTEENGIEASGLSAGTSISLLGNEKLRYPASDVKNPGPIIETSLYQLSYELCPMKYWLEPESKSSTATFSSIISSMIFTINAYHLQALDAAYCVHM